MNCHIAGLSVWQRKKAVIIVGAIAVGVAVGWSLFLLYPDLMFRNIGFDSQSGAGTDVPVIIDP